MTQTKNLSGNTENNNVSGTTIIVTGETETQVKKKGRKPTKKNYFDVREEQAVVRFLECESYEEKNK